MQINHDNIFPIEDVIKHYEQKDGVEIKYICSTELEVDNQVCDVFYRETPHPEFGNRYFGLYSARGNVMIRSADNIEEYEFGMIDCNGVWHYSQARHDFHSTNCGAIDGGRRYTRIVGAPSLPKTKYMKVKEGVFVDDL